jgi:cyclophilin family peptidyl-prolyl cis-trans isomerase
VGAALLATTLAAGVAAGIVVGAAAPAAADVRIRFSTDYGDFDAWLLEEDTPQHVFNFLAYLDDGDYEDSIFHRLIPDFVLQGGGFTVSVPDDPDVDFELDVVPTDPPIINEFKRTNSPGTLALAKLPGDPSSGTSQFFINLVDNGPGSPADLDAQNGGFTVFGCLADPTMAVPMAINEVEVVDVSSDFGGSFTDAPFENYVPPGVGEPADAREIVDFDVVEVPRVEGPCPGCDRKARGPLVAKLVLDELGTAKVVPDVKFKLFGDHWTALGDGIDLRGTLVPREGNDRKFDLLPDACGMEGLRTLLAALGTELAGEGFTVETDDPAPALRARLNKRKTKWIVRAKLPVTGDDDGEPVTGTLVVKTRSPVSKLD